MAAASPAQATITLTAPTSPAAPPPAPAPVGVGTGIDVLGLHLDWMVLALIAIIAGVAYSLYRAQRNQQNEIDLFDIVSEGGRLSRGACVLVGSFGITTWMMIQLTLNGKMTEGYFGLYSAAWIAPTVTRMIVNGAASPPAKKTEG